MKKFKKKGVITFGNATSMVLSLVVMAMVAAAGVIALIGFRDGSSDATANTSINSAVTGIGNFTNQFGTIGTIMGVSLLLLLIVGVFAAIGGRSRGGGL